MSKDAERYKRDNERTNTIIEWSEFHYHLFSHLIRAECPRELAEGIELYLFPNSWIPDNKRMLEAVEACIDSEDPENLNIILVELLTKWKREGLQANGLTLHRDVNEHRE